MHKPLYFQSNGSLIRQFQRRKNIVQNTKCRLSILTGRLHREPITKNENRCQEFTNWASGDWFFCSTFSKGTLLHPQILLGWVWNWLLALHCAIDFLIFGFYIKIKAFPEIYPCSQVIVVTYLLGSLTMWTSNLLHPPPPWTSLSGSC